MEIRNHFSTPVWLAATAAVTLFAGCNFAPRYEKSAVPAAPAYKELTPDSARQVYGWKTAEPNDSAMRGPWWEIFGDERLNALEAQINSSNQTVAAAFANFLSARALLKQNVSQLFPTVSADPSVVRSRQSTVRSGTNSATGGGTKNPNTLYTLPIDATWEPDFWGQIRNTIKASRLEAQATQADLENTRLTVHAELASDYFQLRAQDALKFYLDAAVAADRESLRLTRVRHKTGIASDQDVAQAETLLYTTEAQATDLGILRAQLEHAIATLIGQPASGFSLTDDPLQPKPVSIPFDVPSELLERRPDIAAAERRMHAANAQIGVARAAYFPTVTLSGPAAVGYQSSSTANLFSGPAFVWSVGGTLSETLFDAGKRRGVTEQAWANYQATASNYRQTVLAAFQDVEDNLAALRILSQETQEQDSAVSASQHYLALANDRYRLGIDSYLNVITAETTLLSNQRTAVNLRLQQFTASIQLIKALGGGWTSASLK